MTIVTVPEATAPCCGQILDGAERLAQLIGEMAVSKPIDPVAYLQAAMKPKARKVSL